MHKKKKKQGGGGVNLLNFVTSVNVLRSDSPLRAAERQCQGGQK